MQPPSEMEIIGGLAESTVLRGTIGAVLPASAVLPPVAVGRLVEPGDLGNLEFNIRNCAQLNLMTSLSSLFSPFEVPGSLGAVLVSLPPRQLRRRAGATVVLEVELIWVTLNRSQPRAGAAGSVCRLLVR